MTTPSKQVDQFKTHLLEIYLKRAKGPGVVKSGKKQITVVNATENRKLIENQRNKNKKAACLIDTQNINSLVKNENASQASPLPVA